MQNNKKDKTLFQNKRFNIVLSLVLAVATWVAVALYIDPEKTKTIDKVPVDFSYNSPSYTGQNLDIIAKPNMYVNITVEGDGYVVDSLHAEDFTVYPSYTQVKGAGKYELMLNSKTMGSQAFKVMAISPEFVEVQFDKVVSKKFPVTVLATGIETEIGYFMDQPLAAPAEVTLTGPEAQMANVSKVVANVMLVEKRKDSVITNAPLEIQDKDGNVITGSNITMDAEQIEARIPILEEREIPIKIGFVGAPTGFDTSSLKMELSNDVIRVAGQTKLWDTFKELDAGYVDLTKFEIDGEYTFPITLPDGFINMDKLLSVTATFDTQGLVTKPITVTDIRVSGATPIGLTLKVPNNAKIKNVVLVGPKDEIDEITPQSVVAQMNAQDVSLSNAKQNVPVQILIPSSSKIFAIGSYTVLCDTTVN
ncbi:MAG: CdaR family protein [Oscillospiraceae bacterium]